MRPKKLPRDWIVVTSKSHPNRVYYFNVKTNKASWEVPDDESGDGPKGKKRKSASDDGVCTPTTPEYEAPEQPKSSSRPMLRARRTTLPASRNRDPETSASASTTPKETAQMRQLREQMLARQSKSNAPGRTKPALLKPSSEPQNPKPTDEKSPTVCLPAAEQRYLTPQMKIILEKMQNRRSKTKPPKTPPKIDEIPEVTTPLRRPRSKSVILANSPTKDPPKPIRRTSRRTTNASSHVEKSNDVGTNDVSSSEVSSTVLTIVPGRRNDSVRESTVVLKKTNRITTPTKKESPTPERTKIPRLGRSALKRKNLAEERLAELRKSLGNDNSTIDETSSPVIKKTHENRVESVELEVSLRSADERESPPSIYKNAAARMKFLRERIRNRSIYEEESRTFSGERNTSTMGAEVGVNGTDGVDGSGNFCEEMEWEPIEDDKIMREIEVVRSYISATEGETVTRELSQNSLDLPDGPTPAKTRSLYIVIDTNVFLSNLGAIEEARDTVFRTYGRPLIVVPWTVIRELDFIKDDKSMTRPEFLKAKARQAVRFLNHHFTARHPRVLGQTPMDVANNRQKFVIECPDDEILQTCLQIRLSNNSVVLLSYDKNLCNKAMIHDVVTLGRHDPLEKVDYLHASDAQNDSHLTQHLRGEDRDRQAVPIFVKELRMAEEILIEAKEILTSFLSVIVAKEMQNLYNDHWEKYTLMRPPWSVHAVLTCALKHWIAAISEAFTKRAEPLLKELQKAMNKSRDSGLRLSDVSHILETMNDLLQCVKVDKYTNIMVRSGRSITQLRAKCLEATQQLHEEQLQETIGCQENEEEARANIAFQYFEEVYAFARDMCGLASEAIGMPCSFPYKKINPLPSIETLKVLQPDIAANLNRLLQVLSTALEELNGLHVDHRAVLALYNALSTFMPDERGQIPRDLSPLDVYWCLRTKEKVLRSGLVQLQELSSHFCRMASFRCT